MRQKIVLVLFMALALIVLVQRSEWFFPEAQQRVSVDAPSQLRNAFEKQLSNFQVEGSGTVVKILPDDLHGTRHQRFILEVTDGQTVLVAHNIDLAPRLTNLRRGDTVTFYGEYEWNEKGGVIHWTHHDPGNKHIDGWLGHNGRMYR